MAGCQYGFRPIHSTEQAVTKFIADTLDAREKNENTLATFLDLSKAFDTIDHKILLEKLKYYGIRGVAFDWFMDYLNERKQYVLYNNKKSDIFDIICGVPQGSVLGPLLFILYTNDLPQNLAQTKCILYADDTTVYLSDQNQQDLFDRMNKDLAILSDWFKANNLSLNSNKSNHVFFAHNTKSVSCSRELFIDESCIDRVKCTKFLGLHIDEDLQWHEQINYCRKKITNGLYALNMSKHFLSTQNLKMIYYSLIHPFLQYGLMLWGSTYKKYLKKIEVLQKKAIRIVCKTIYNEHSAPLFKRMKIPNLDCLFKLQVGKFMYTVKNKLTPTSLQNVFTANHNVHIYNTRQRNDVHYKPIKKNIVHKSFLCKGPEFWSGFPSEIKQANSFNSFKSKLKKYLISLIV